MSPQLLSLYESAKVCTSLEQLQVLREAGYQELAGYSDSDRFNFLLCADLLRDGIVQRNTELTTWGLNDLFDLFSSLETNTANP